MVVGVYWGVGVSDGLIVVAVFMKSFGLRNVALNIDIASIDGDFLIDLSLELLVSVRTGLMIDGVIVAIAVGIPVVVNILVRVGSVFLGTGSLVGGVTVVVMCVF